MNKTLVIGLILIVLMVSPALINLITPLVNKVKLPAGNIVAYELSLQQKNLALNQGRVLMEFFYGNSCTNCQSQISFLESLATQYKNTTFLEEVSVSNSTQILNLIGFNITGNKVYLDERSLDDGNITEANVKATLCQIMLVPPIDCALNPA